MKFNPAYIFTAISSILISVVISFFLQNDTETVTTYGIFDVEKAIELTSMPLLKNASSDDEARRIVRQSTRQVDKWLEFRMPKHCPSPCVIFRDEKDVMGDVVNLEKIYLREARLN